MKNISLSNFIEEIIIFNQIWQSSHNEKLIQSCEQYVVPK